jgi:hypothetical protein
MLHQYSSVSSWMQTCIVMKETLHQMPVWPYGALFVFCNTRRSWAHRRQTSLTWTYKNLLPDKTSASILAVTMLRSNLSMYVFFVYNNFFLIACFVDNSLDLTFWIDLTHKTYLHNMTHSRHIQCVPWMRKWPFKGTSGATFFCHYRVLRR